MSSIHDQLKLDTPIPQVSGNHDFDQLHEQLTAIDDIITSSEIEESVVDFYLDYKQSKRDEWLRSQGRPPKPFTAREKISQRDTARTLFRAAMLRKRTGESLRVFCRTVAESALRQWFCGIPRLVEAKIFSKSALGDFENILPDDLLRRVHSKLLISGANDVEPSSGLNTIGFDAPVTLEQWYVDTTCLMANIHFPVDWVLLVDIVRTLMLAVAWTRKHGLRNRMPKEPRAFITEMNKLSIEMSQCRRKKNAKKHRKRILRRMKKHLKKVVAHARAHADLLRNTWDQSEHTWFEGNRVLRRVEGILAQVDHVVHQAHERIIGERRVPNHRKILSMYEDHVHVIVRGKAGSEVEFGNTLYIAEQKDGIIVDYYLSEDKSPGDPALLCDSIDRAEAGLGITPDVIAGDRGFDSPDVRDKLEHTDTYNAVVSRSVPKMQSQLEDASFCRHQNRRAQTEGRIAIIKGFTANPMLQNGIRHRKIHVALSILSHNLWKIAGIRIQQERKRSQQKRAAAA